MNAEEKRETCMVQLVKSQADLYAFVRSLMPFNAANVDDVVQETNIALIKRAEEYDPARPFRTWLFTFARLQVLKFFTLRKREPLVFDEALAEQSAGLWEDILPGDADAHSTANLLKNLARCKERLRPRQRELLDAYYLRGESLVSIAKRQQANAHTLSTLLGYIRGKLGDCIRRQCHLDDTDDAGEPTSEESLLNDVLADPANTRHEADRLHECLKSPELLRYWDEQSLVHALLAYERSAAVPLPLREPKPWWRRVERFAAAAVILLLAGLAVAAVVRLAAVRESKATSSGILSPSAIAETSAAAASLPVAVTPTAVVTSNSLGVSVLLPATVLRVAPPLEATAEAAAVTEGENMKMKSIAAAAAVAVAAVTPPAVTQATENPSVVVTCLTDQGWIETRWIVEALTEGRDTWTLSTVPPAGTIYKLF